ncbi:hypothetical protein [Geoalkalibacter subterraneus]|uniref:Uncharacterized protein n=1 Tax=Geoalkalibacter subterraneus TaxID=483547 RepID=A0A0B5FLA5_9BACT|nr:hypothetical protein [Geoalkalibacter subterraneus]AJF08183.1 hypothetical protein GSUB_16950 [Geoalkalibacter subterraneus]
MSNEMVVVMVALGFLLAFLKKETRPANRRVHPKGVITPFQPPKEGWKPALSPDEMRELEVPAFIRRKQYSSTSSSVLLLDGKKEEVENDSTSSFEEEESRDLIVPEII